MRRAFKFFKMQAREDSSKKQSPDVLREKVALKSFSKFKGKRLCPSLFFNKAAGLGVMKSKLGIVAKFHF